MSVKVHIPTPMRQHTNGQATVQATGTTVKDVLGNLGQKFPGITERLFDNGQVRRFVNVYLNDEDIRYLENLNTEVKDGDEVSIVVLGPGTAAPIHALAHCGPAIVADKTGDDRNLDEDAARKMMNDEGVATALKEALKKRAAR